MDSNIKVLIVAAVFIILFISLPTKCWSNNNVEGFYPYYGAYKKYCGSCSGRSIYSAGKCTNCGICYTQPKEGGPLVSQSVAGDSRGPYFKKDCIYWNYGNPYHHYPYDHIFPVYQVRSFK